MFLLEWHSPDGDFIYGYKTMKELMSVIDTFIGKPYIHYDVYQINSMQKMLFSN
jgi:hypothetical protein